MLAKTFKRDVLAHPDGPTIAIISPLAKDPDTQSRMHFFGARTPVETDKDRLDHDSTYPLSTIFDI